MEDSAFLWGIEVAGSTRWHRVLSIFSAQNFNKINTAARPTHDYFAILAPSHRSASDLGTMVCLGRAWWETPFHFDPHTAYH